MRYVKTFLKCKNSLNAVKNLMNRVSSVVPGLVVVLACCWVISHATAGNGAMSRSGEHSNSALTNDMISQVDLIAAQTAIGISHPQDAPVMVMAGLRFRLAPGWKTYWRSPGDAGYPPTVDWSKSENLAQATLWWPAPKRYFDHGLQTIGYENEVILPLTLQVINPDLPLSITAMVDYLVCEEICIPVQQNVALVVPPGLSEPTPESRLIDRYRAALPETENPQTPPTIIIQEMAPDAATDAVKLRAMVHSPNSFQEPDLFLEGADGTWFSQPETILSEGGKRVQFTLTAGGFPSFIDTDLKATLVDGKRAWERDITVVRPSMDTKTGLAAILVLAFLGGLILNLMPCVLPVLSLKILSVIDHADGMPSRMRFLATASGIMTSFMVLALGLILLQAGGQRIGWGVQFQQPVFLATMAVIVTLFACNLWGWLPISAPRFLLDRLPTGGREQSWLSHFTTGVFATLLATPCSAPFLGTAVGFALAGDAGDILVVFITLGIGFSTPYLLLAFSPITARWLPKPGAWMNRFKSILGILLAATALWLITVIAAQSGLMAAVVTGIFLTGLILGLAIAAYPTIWRRKRPDIIRRAGHGIGLLCSMAAIVTIAILKEPESTLTSRINDDHANIWHRFDQVQLHQQVSAGKTVLVDVTADWCLTCQVNKHLVLEDPTIEALIQQEKILPMRADWTRPDPMISDYLAAYGRYGIPFNIVYGPGAPAGIRLPELLTLTTLNTALDRAGPPTASE